MNNATLFDYATSLHKRLKKIKELSQSEKHTTESLSIFTLPNATEIPMVVVFAQRDPVKIIDQDLDDLLTPLVVCPANANQPCGKWVECADGYEENLAYRSTLAMALTAKQYPLKADESIYCGAVCFFRDHLYHVLKRSLRVGVIAVATVKHPDFSIENDVVKVYGKLEMIFITAIKYGHSSIIMPAFGCADDNDPTEIARLLKKLVHEYKFYIKRLTIQFDQTVNDPNFLTFKKIINSGF